MKAPDFWQKRPPTLLARLLAPLGALYGWIVARRMARPGTDVGIPVICVGNFVAGGAGKTPVALALAAALRDKGFAPAFLTRGYGGRQGKTPVLVELSQHGARDVGDEALLLARLAPTFVSADRVAGARAAKASGANLIIMDDGMQNPALRRIFTLAVMDGARGSGNGLCLPAGPLRAPVALQAPFIDAILAIGLGAGVAEALEIGKAKGKPAFRSDFIVDDAIGEQLAGQRVFAFAGIGHPQKFFDTLAGLYAKVDQARAFPDHHAFTEIEAMEILEVARARKLRIVTTEKDAVRLKGSPALEALAAETLALPVQISLPPALVRLALEAVGPARHREEAEGRRGDPS